jgi:hypothetical protein
MLNMAQTTNYNCEIPDDTDLVKDGALAMRDLGQDVDTTLATALNANDYSGLVLLKTQTIGSAVSSVTVTDAFLATYRSYKVIIENTTGSVNDSLFYVKFDNSTNYYSAFTGVQFGGAITSGSVNNTTLGIQIGLTSTTSSCSNFDVINPFLSTKTQVTGSGFTGFAFGGTGSSGFTADSNSNTDLIISIGAGTITGGTIYVYGYGAS